MASMTKEQFSALVPQFERLVYTVCFQLVRDAAAAEDLTQDTFLSAYIHRDSMPQGYERQWLARIAANKAKDHLQSAWNRRTVLPGDQELPQGLAPPAEEVALRRSGAAEARTAIEHMKEPGGGRPGPGPAGQDRIYTALPGQTAAAGGIGKGWKPWYFVTTGT